jgi:predicted kinase
MDNPSSGDNNTSSPIPTHSSTSPGPPNIDMNNANTPPSTSPPPHHEKVQGDNDSGRPATPKENTDTQRNNNRSPSFDSPRGGRGGGGGSSGGGYRGGGGRGGGYSHSNQPQSRISPTQEWAATQLTCEPHEAEYFQENDPLNQQNRVAGYICKSNDNMIIMSVSNEATAQQQQPSPPLLIFPTPSFAQVRGEGGVFAPRRESFSSYYLAHKWNGVNITVYKYTDAANNVFVTAKTRSVPFLKDTDHGKFRTLFLDVLAGSNPQWDTENNKYELPISIYSLPTALLALGLPTVQSATFELCGARVPHIVRYPFQLALMPLFITFVNGKISPFMESNNPHRNVSYCVQMQGKLLEMTSCINNFVSTGLGVSFGPITVVDKNSVEYMEAVCEKLRNEAYEVNATYRASQGGRLKEGCYWFDHFLVEGWVLYLLDSLGVASSNTIYKVKPKDTVTAHSEKFDAGAQTLVLMTVREMYEKGKNQKDVMKTLKTELDMTNETWLRWNRDILALVEGVPPRYDISQFSHNTQRMLLLVGLPGSGKSTFANKLVGHGWERVNQDEQGTRKKCEVMTTQLLQEGKNVIIDRCNFDFSQRHVWVKMATSLGVQWITCITLRTPPEVCKARVSVRMDHPTIAPGEEGAAIIDKFADIFVDPNPLEGFVEVLDLHTDEEIDNCIAKLKISRQPPINDVVVVEVSKLTVEVQEKNNGEEETTRVTVVEEVIAFSTSSEPGQN